jgi:hypothetical protein
MQRHKQILVIKRLIFFADFHVQGYLIHMARDSCALFFLNKRASTWVDRWWWARAVERRHTYEISTEGTPSKMWKRLCALWMNSLLWLLSRKILAPPHRVSKVAIVESDALSLGCVLYCKIEKDVKITKKIGNGWIICRMVDQLVHFACEVLPYPIRPARGPRIILRCSVSYILIQRSSLYQTPCRHPSLTRLVDCNHDHLLES